MLKLSLLLFFIFIAPACRKETTSTPEQILIRRPWTITAYGFDDNKNGKIDPEENMITDCQKDNTYEFRFDGTLLIMDNVNTCNVNSGQTVKWKLINNKKDLDLEFYIAPILHLSERQMVLSHQYLAEGFQVVYNR